MIIIETPAPPTRERLVLVPLDTVSREAGAELLTIRTANARDATPEDLARAGCQLGEALQRAATAERERGEARADRDAQLVRALDAERDLGATMREVATLRAELARLTAVEGEPTPGQLLDACQPSGGVERLLACYRLGVAHERARQPAQDRATDEELADLYAREYDAQAHQTRDPFSYSDCRRAAVAAVAAHVRGERCLIARAVASGAEDVDQRQLGEALQRAATAERERGEARADRDAQLVRALDAERDLGATMREVATLRAELARLTAVEGEPTDDAWQHAGAGVTEAWLYRAGVARERARQARTEPRATDEELFAIADAVYEEAHGGEIPNGLHEIARRVAAHVRAERCLVTRAVAANVDIRVCEDVVRGGFLVGVHAPDCDEDLERNVPAADVPATLVRLLGEVGHA